MNENLIALDRLYFNDSFIVDWKLGLRCNYDCTYCGPSNHNNYSPHIDKKNIYKFIDKLKDYTNGRNIILGFTGGEPTVHPDFSEICSYAKKADIHQVSVTTNGTRTAEYYLKLYEHVDSCSISHHFEYECTDKFLNKIKTINDQKNSKKYLKIQVMLHADYFQQALEAIEFYKDNNINFTVRKIRDELEFKINRQLRSAARYTNSQLLWLDENYTDQKSNVNTKTFILNGNDIEEQESHFNYLMASGQNDFQNWICYAGIDYIAIKDNGDIYRGNCKQGGLIGNLSDEFINFPTEPVICNINQCFCGPEVSIRKVKDKKYFYLINESTI